MFWNPLMARLLPRLCLLCEAACGSEALCPPCRAFLPGSTRRRCLVCARPWHTSLRCAGCRAAPPAYAASLAAADYCAPLDRALTALKFSGQIGLAAGLGALLAQAWLARSATRNAAVGAEESGDRHTGAGYGGEVANEWLSTSAGRRMSGPASPLPGGSTAFPPPGAVDCIVPVPLSAPRLAERGFNQAGLIAVAMVRHLKGRPGAPVLQPSFLSRHRDTAEQSRLGGEARRANLDHGFVAAGRVHGLRVAVLDDVMTTGATLQAAALALKGAGAAEVVNLVVARTA
jgi:predicted amidophosphoribosyltransferase